MNAVNKERTAAVSRTAAILGAVLALLVGFYLGFTAHGLMDGKKASSQPATAQSSAPATTQPTVDPALAERIKAVEKQTQLEPANTAAWTQLGNLFFDTQQPEKAIAAYEKSLTLNPQQADVLTDEGVMYRQVGQFDKAIECFNKAIALNPSHIIAHYNKSVVLEHDKNDKAGAIAALKALAAKNPNAALPNGETVTQTIQQMSAN